MHRNMFITLLGLAWSNNLATVEGEYISAILQPVFLII